MYENPNGPNQDTDDDEEEVADDAPELDLAEMLEDLAVTKQPNSGNNQDDGMMGD